MELQDYVSQFQKAADLLNKKLLQKKQFEVAVGTYMQCPFLKIYKSSWASPLQDPLTAESRIFFSVWADDAAMQEQKLWYNIHALKLRKLKGYKIESRKFADLFRAHFKPFTHQWPNVSVQFGPLTLMQGWVKVDIENFEAEILQLTDNFFAIEYLIDDTLACFK